jgi:ubiquinone/menaquinone biosynthesis C-methylase UbiE/rhodanese-related sulfurtransferase
MIHAACAAILGAATEKLVEFAKLRPGQTVLDLACGAGPVAWLAAPRVRPGGRVVSIDASEEAIQAARRLVESAGVSEVELRVGRAEALDFPDATFDAVLCQLGLEFCESPARVLDEIARVLKPGGCVAVMALGAKDRNRFLTLPYEALCAAQSRAPSIDRYFQVGTAETLEEWFQGAGLMEARCQAVGVMLEVTNPESLWQVATSITGWPAGEYALASEHLARALRDTAKLSMEVVLGLAVKPVDPREAARPRSFDELVAATRLRVREITPFEARRAGKDKNLIFLDVREREEIGTGILPKAMHVPRGQMEMLVPQRTPDPKTPIIVYSDDGRRSVLAALRLQQLGYQNVWNLHGGFRAWHGNAYQIEHPQ